MSDREISVDDEAAITAAEERTLATFKALRSTLDQARAMGLDVSEDEAALIEADVSTLPALGVAATPLHDAGVAVMVPTPERYAVHKLIVAYSDEAGRGFRFEAGRHSEAKPATVPI